MKWSELRNLSNILSLSRPLLFLPLIALTVLWFNWIFIGAVLYLFGAATDVLDGRFARKRNEVTVTGKLLDPIADKLFFDLTPFFFYPALSPFLWNLFAFAYIPLECLLFLGGFYAWLAPSQNIFSVGSNQGGKWKTATITVFTVLLFANELAIPVSEKLLIAVLSYAAAFALMSFAGHIKEYLKSAVRM